MTAETSARPDAELRASLQLEIIAALYDDRPSLGTGTDGGPYCRAFPATGDRPDRRPDYRPDIAVIGIAGRTRAGLVGVLRCSSLATP